MAKTPKRRSGVAMAAMFRKSAKFKHRNEPRGGQTNEQLNFIQEYQNDLDDARAAGMIDDDYDSSPYEE
jgi:hypothetical protein